MHRRTLLAAALALAALPASAQSGLKLEGDYVLDTARGEPPAGSINRAVSRLSTVQRAVVRGQLIGVTRPAQTLKLALRANEVTLTFGDQPPLMLQANGTPVQWARGGGATAQARASMAAGALTLVIVQGGYTQTQVLRPLDATTLTVEASVTSPDLTVPVTYRTFYVRQ